MRTSLNGSSAGFSLVETLVSVGILSTALLGLAGVMAVGLKHMAGSSAALVAREKAREAVESVHTARDTRVITWAKIRNKEDGGVFENDATDLKTPGPDGLVNTGDDTGIEILRSAGQDHILGNSDDVLIPLKDFKRRIQIIDITDGEGHVNPNLREIVVTIDYKVNGAWRTYTLTTYISSFS